MTSTAPAWVASRNSPSRAASSAATHASWRPSTGCGRVPCRTTGPPPSAGRTSATGLARGLHRLTSLPEARRALLAEAGQETVSSRFAVTEMAAALAHAYAETVHRT
ncbi:hypothetical protein JS756_22315 [Streptomyces actuosus]|uniref:Glycosyl transferase family 1 domain-containing protein n=1 Tax=Streptomyces actuosus TaxID=1885 RepID=A0ABS2VUQ0_STRAS|nr:hypothetical protein [Streptomyces actuosus]MBN0046793.1 hypothetical protein [Streptomyces actuosus]